MGSGEISNGQSHPPLCPEIFFLFKQIRETCHVTLWPINEQLQIYIYIYFPPSFAYVASPPAWNISPSFPSVGPTPHVLMHAHVCMPLAFCHPCIMLHSFLIHRLRLLPPFHFFRKYFLKINIKYLFIINIIKLINFVL